MMEVFVATMLAIIIFILGMFVGIVIAMFIVSCKMFRRYYWHLETPMLDYIKKNMENK